MYAHRVHQEPGHAQALHGQEVTPQEGAAGGLTARGGAAVDQQSKVSMVVCTVTLMYYCVVWAIGFHKWSVSHHFL